jgi:glutamate transport system permease protein
MSTSVLYDVPGPRTRQRVRIGSIAAGVVLLGVLFVVYRRLDAQEQFAAEKWAPLFEPGHEAFGQVWDLLLEALVKTLQAAVLAMAFSLVIGTLLAVTRFVSAPWYRWAVVGLVELLRGVPVVLAIFFASRVLPEVGVDLSILWYLVIGLTAYNSVVIAEIVRAGINALPKGQTEAAYAIGLTRGQTLRLVLLPQAFRIMLPALISQLVVVLKDTSLGAFIGYQELLRTGGFLVQNLANPIQTYLLIAVLFIAINYLLSKFAEYVERRLRRSGRGAPPVPVPGETDESGLAPAPVGSATTAPPGATGG